jgi:hypothetical protein
MEIDFDTLFTDGSTTLEIYLCPTYAHQNNDVNVGWTKPIQAKLRFGTGSNIEEFHHKDLVCSYDTSNDSQKVVRKVVTKDYMFSNIYIVVYTEDQMPAFYFPMTRDISNKTEIQRRSFRVNNRMYITHDHEGENDYYYIKYTHSLNVDMTKMKEDLNDALQKLTLIAAS